MFPDGHLERWNLDETSCARCHSAPGFAAGFIKKQWFEFYAFNAATMFGYGTISEVRAAYFQIERWPWQQFVYRTGGNSCSCQAVGLRSRSGEQRRFRSQRSAYQLGGALPSPHVAERASASLTSLGSRLHGYRHGPSRPLGRGFVPLYVRRRGFTRQRGAPFNRDNQGVTDGTANSSA